MSARDVSDLDFTQILKPVAARPRAEPAPRPSGTEPARRQSGNFIAFAKGGAARRAPAVANAPILVVEDDASMRALLEKLLTLQGFPVRLAADGDQFKQAMRPPLPRLVLLDIELPRVSGLRILSVLRQHPQTAHVPVIMVTSRSDSKDLAQALALGADGYVTKPLTPSLLRSVIDKVLAPQP